MIYFIILGFDQVHFTHGFLFFIMTRHGFIFISTQEVKICIGSIADTYTCISLKLAKQAECGICIQVSTDVFEITT